MKKFLLTLFSLIFVTSFSYAQRSEITKFEGKEIKGVIVSGAFDVNIKLGKETKSTVSVLDEGLDKLTYELTDDNYIRLSYGSNSGSLFVGQKKRPRAEITLSTLEYLKLSGSAVLIGSGTFKTDKKFVMTVSGSAFASFVMVECAEAAVSIDGTSKIEDIKINATKDTNIEITGSANATIAGSSPKARITAQTASAIDLLQFKCPVYDAITSGTSVIKLDVSGEARVTTSGLSAVRYIGDGKVIGDGAKRL